MEPFDRKRYTPATLKRIEADAFQEGNKLTVARLEQLLHDASYAYYNTDRVLLTDAAFDILYDLLKQKSPGSALLTTIGAELPADAPNKVVLPYHLGSMDKVKPGSRDLELWLQRYRGPYTVSEKLDGLSGLLTIGLLPDGTAEMHLYRRGDSDVAQEVSHLLAYIRYNDLGLAKLLKKMPGQVLALRGEIIIKNEVFHAKYADRYPKPRSLINGVALSKPESFLTKPGLVNTARDVEYVVYSVMDPPGLTHEAQFALAKKLGFLTAHAEQFRELTQDSLQELLIRYKTESAYAIDGIILADDSRVYDLPTSGNPKYAVAFKMMLDEQTQETEVIRVEWNVTKNKVLKPRVEFKPVKIGGDTISFATGFNAKHIKEHGIGPGALIRIVRSGDVIPYITAVLKPAPRGWQEPDVDWEWDGIEARPTDMTQVPDYLNRELLHFFNTLEVDGIREGTLDKLIQAGFDDLRLILALEPANLLDVSGFQIKSARALVDAIKKSVLNKHHRLEVLMTASNCFTGFGVKKLGPIVHQLGVAAVLAGDVSREELVGVPGISTVSADKFLEQLPAFLEWLREHPMLEVERGGAAGSPEPLPASSGPRVVFTGFRDKVLEEEIRRYGGQVVETINAATQLVVAKDPSAASSKLTKARSLGIPVVGLAGFKAKDALAKL